MRSEAKNSRVVDGIFLPAGKVEAQAISHWKLLTMVALTVMNASWASAFLRTIAYPGAQRNTLILIIFFTLLPLATVFILTAVQALKLTASAERTAGLAVLVIAVLAAFGTLLYPDSRLGLGVSISRFLAAFTNLDFALHPEPVVAVLILIFWRRGLSLARHWIGPLVVQRDFRIALIALLILGFAAAGLARPLPYVEVFLCLFAALMAMGGARLTTLSKTRGGRSIPFDRQWFLAVSAGAFGLIALTGGMAYFGAGPLASGLGRALAFIGSALGAVLLFLLRPVIVLITELFNRLLAGLMPLISQTEPQLQSLPAPDEVSQMMEDLSAEITPAPFAGGLLDTLQIILIGVGLLIFVLVVYFSLRSTRAGRLWRNLEEGERETILGSIPDYLRSLLRSVRRAPQGLERLNPAAQVIAAARIRQIYRRLLRLSSRLGVERDESETPLEFLGDLPVIFPDVQAELEDITGAYLRVRYGEYPESRQEVDRVEAAWRQVRKRGRPLPDSA